MEFLVGDKLKELEVIGENGTEDTEDFIGLAELLKDGQVWEDEYENFCMSEDTYEYWENMCRMQTNITKMAGILNPYEYGEYVSYCNDTSGYDYDIILWMREQWLITKIALRG